MAGLKKEEHELAATVATAKLNEEATMAWAMMQQLLFELHMT